MIERKERQLLDHLATFLPSVGCKKFLISTSGIAVGASGPTGFDMALVMSDGDYIVTFDAWEETYSDPEFVYALFVDALTGAARLRVDTLGGKPWRWTVERRRANDRWIAESTIGRPNWRFWSEAGTYYLRNEFRLNSC